ncbi:MAG: SIMPL domain-containing protein [Terriglobales bacterium]
MRPLPRLWAALALPLLLAVGSPALGAVAQAPSPAPAVIQVSAQGQFQADPDLALVQFEVSGQNPDLSAAYTETQSQAAQLRNVLSSQGFPSTVAHWSNFQVQPNIDYRTHHVTSYTVSLYVRVELADFSKIGPLLNATSAKGLNLLRGVSFELKDTSAAKSAAIAAGYHQAQAEAQALAHAAGRQLGPLVDASVDAPNGSLAPQPRMLAMASAAAPAPTEQFAPGRITVSANVRLVFSLRP